MDNVEYKIGKLYRALTKAEEFKGQASSIARDLYTGGHIEALAELGERLLGEAEALKAKGKLFKSDGFTPEPYPNQWGKFKALRTMIQSLSENRKEGPLTLNAPNQKERAKGAPVTIGPKGTSRGGNARGGKKADADKPVELKAELTRLVEKFGLDSVLEVLAAMEPAKPEKLKAVA